MPKRYESPMPLHRMFDASRILKESPNLFSLEDESSSLFLSAELINSSEFTLACLDETENDEEDKQEGTKVRFAPCPTTISIMGLDDYTPKEVKACWYSQRDVDNFRRLDYVNNCKKALSFPLSRSKRWDA